MKNTLYTGFQEGALSIIVGKSGSGKTHLLQKNSEILDTDKTVIIDYGMGLIFDSNTKGFDAKGKYFPQSTYIDLQNKLNFSIDDNTVLRTRTLIIDEGCYVFSQRRINEQINRLINSVLLNNGRVVIIFQHEDDLKMIGKHANQADHVEEITGTPGKVKIYTFKQEK